MSNYQRLLKIYLIVLIAVMGLLCVLASLSGLLGYLPQESMPTAVGNNGLSEVQAAGVFFSSSSNAIRWVSYSIFRAITWAFTLFSIIFGGLAYLVQRFNQTVFSKIMLAVPTLLLAVECAALLYIRGLLLPVYATVHLVFAIAVAVVLVLGIITLAQHDTVKESSNVFEA